MKKQIFKTKNIFTKKIYFPRSFLTKISNSEMAKTLTTRYGPVVKGEDNDRPLSTEVQQNEPTRILMRKRKWNDKLILSTLQKRNQYTMSSMHHERSKTTDVTNWKTNLRREQWIDEWNKDDFCVCTNLYFLCTLIVHLLSQWKWFSSDLELAHETASNKKSNIIYRKG